LQIGDNVPDEKSIYGYLKSNSKRKIYQENNALNLISIGIDRIKSAIGLMSLTYNLVRWEQMVRLQKVKIE